MKRILLDESVPQKLRLLIDSYEVVTASYKGWSGLTNGMLLDVAEMAGLDIFITADQALTYQQNLASRKIALVVLSTNNWRAIKTNVADIIAALNEATPGSYTFVQIPMRGGAIG